VLREDLQNQYGVTIGYCGVIIASTSQFSYHSLSNYDSDIAALLEFTYDRALLSNNCGLIVSDQI
jgi:hypothetical protein